jgi:tripartite-type tricarboxylate transporter receptor subunit TctC
LFEALKNGVRLTIFFAQIGSGSHIIMAGILDQLGATGAEHIAYVDANETAIALLGGQH